MIYEITFTNCEYQLQKTKFVNRNSEIVNNYYANIPSIPFKRNDGHH
jgi:hypothetical protein